MDDLKNGTFKVDIRWDDYTVKNNTRWTGDIILKEKLILQNGKTIQLDQNYTPGQLHRDSLSGYFAPLTTFTAEPSSEIILQKNSKLLIDNNSTLILEESSKLVLEKKSQLILKNGARLIIRKGAEIQNKGGKIINKSSRKIINESEN
jgi:hypothetical protein